MGHDRRPRLDRAVAEIPEDQGAAEIVGRDGEGFAGSQFLARKGQGTVFGQDGDLPSRGRLFGAVLQGGDQEHPGIRVAMADRGGIGLLWGAVAEVPVNRIGVEAVGLDGHGFVHSRSGRGKGDVAGEAQYERYWRVLGIPIPIEGPHGVRPDAIVCMGNDVRSSDIDGAVAHVPHDVARSIEIIGGESDWLPQARQGWGDRDRSVLQNDHGFVFVLRAGGGISRIAAEVHLIGGWIPKDMVHETDIESAVVSIGYRSVTPKHRAGAAFHATDTGSDALPDVGRRRWVGDDGCRQG